MPFACDLLAIPPAARGPHQRLTRRLMAEAVGEIREAPDGVALRFPADEYEAVAQFVARERLCCPFLRFTVEVAPGGGPLWLRLSGPEGVTEFLRTELHLPAR